MMDGFQAIGSSLASELSIKTLRLIFFQGPTKSSEMSKSDLGLFRQVKSKALHAFRVFENWLPHKFIIIIHSALIGHARLTAEADGGS
jgi:hypothetical protein